MNHEQAAFLKNLRLFIHDHVVGLGRGKLPIGRAIEELQDALAEYGEEQPVFQKSGLRGQRMFGPAERRPRGPLFRGMKGAVGSRVPVYEQEQALSYEDQDLLMDMAIRMRSVSGTAKAELAKLLDRVGEAPIQNNSLRSLVTALKWLGNAETAFKAIPMEIDLVRERRATGRGPRVLSERDQEAKERREEMMIAKQPLVASMQELSTVMVLNEDDQPIEKEMDDGDIVNEFMAALGSLRQAWFKIAIAMLTAPDGAEAPEDETAAAVEEEGLPAIYTEWHDVDPVTGLPTPTMADMYVEAFAEKQRLIGREAAEAAQKYRLQMRREAREAAKKMTPNRHDGTFGWPRAACM